MSTKRDPVIAVIKYFEETDLNLARQALALCQQTLRRRTPFPARTQGSRKTNGRSTTKTTATTATAGSAPAGSSSD
jgi:hypothetical protein